MILSSSSTQLFKLREAADARSGVGTKGEHLVAAGLYHNLTEKERGQSSTRFLIAVRWMLQSGHAPPN
jgi:hypothetical protein